MQNAILPLRGTAAAILPYFTLRKQKGEGSLRRTFKRIVMLKLLLLVLMASCLPAWGKGFAQGINLSLKNASLEKVFAAIEQQSPYHFIYTKEELRDAKAVNITIQDGRLAEVLDHCLRGQGLEYSIKEPYVIIKKKEGKRETAAAETANPIEIGGKVLNADGEPVAGATVTVKGSKKATATNERGEWRMEIGEGNVIILISSIGYESKEVAIGKDSQLVVLNRAVNSLDETVVIAYGKTTKRLNTGNVSKVSAEEIARQPVSNPLAALQGRVPGMVVTQSTGVPGGGFSVEIRGRTSLDESLSRNDPLIIIDGVPFEPGNEPVGQLASAARNPRQTSVAGLSPLNNLNPADIESIEVLKDADATAIYGSRGANGVIIINTKQGAAGELKVNASMYMGFSKVTRTMGMMNTSQYVSLRKEAFANDGIVPNANNGYDILLWDTTRYTDFKKKLIGNTAQNKDWQISLSGGNAKTKFFVGGGYHVESNVFSSSLTDRKGSLRFTITQTDSKSKFRMSLSGGYSHDKNQLIRTDMTNFINTLPHLLLYDSSGKLNWQEKGVAFNNPLAILLKRYTSIITNLQGNLQLSYQITPNLQIRSNIGYNSFATSETLIDPQQSISPNTSTLAFSTFANSGLRSWIVEPQAEYTYRKRLHQISFLLGSSLQERISESQRINGTNYTSDLLLYSMEAAGNITVNNQYSQYRYISGFGRLNYNYADKYLLNITGRRDGSTRFGPGKRLANFGAAGVAWLFSNERGIKERIKFLSYGKVRGSYGVTGNDQIGDYKFLDLWNSTSVSYQGTPGLVPASLFNPNYNWERNRKLEGAIELGFKEDRIFFSASFYRNRSNNQLINYDLPPITGFAAVNQNLNALVQNTGVEMVFSIKNNKKRKLQWESSLNITRPKNKLLEFPNLQTSNYVNSYVIGKSLNVVKRLKFLGIDTATGVYQFLDLNGDAVYNSSDYIVLTNTDVKFYGGFNSNFYYKGFGLSFLIDYRNQRGRNYLHLHSSFYPGSIINQPLIVLNRWRKPGDAGPIQRATTGANSQAGGGGATRLSISDGIYGDASFLRLRNLAFSYSLPKTVIGKLKMKEMKIYLHSQNLITLTRYQGGDPESQNLYRLPPLKTFVFGININL